MTQSYGDLYGLFPVDIQQYTDALKGTGANGVLSGMNASVTGTDLTVTIASGYARVDGTYRNFASSTNVSFTGIPDTVSPKKCLIVINAAGTITHRDGSAASPNPAGEVKRLTVTPDPPVTTAGDVVLFEVWLDANATAIHADDVSDRRIVVKRFPTPSINCIGYGTGTNSATVTFPTESTSWTGNLMVVARLVNNSGNGTGNFHLKFQGGIGTSAYFTHYTVDNSSFTDETSTTQTVLCTADAYDEIMVKVMVACQTDSKHYMTWEGYRHDTNVGTQWHLRGCGMWNVQNAVTEITVTFNGTGTSDLCSLTVYAMPIVTV